MRLFDLHCDTLYECATKKIDMAVNDLHISLERGLIFADDWIQTFAIWMPDELRGQAALDHFKYCYDYFIRQIDKHGDIIIQCKTHDDLLGNSGKCKAVLAVEGGSVLAGDERNLDYLYNCGVKMITLTWNDYNELASGAFSKVDSGLTDVGIRAVKHMNELSIIPDVSHLSDKSFDMLCSVSDRPFIATHSNLRALCNNPRNLTDEQFRVIANRSGIVGINLYTKFINGGEDCSFEQIKAHIDRGLKLGGENILCIGTDFDGADMPSKLNCIDKMIDFYRWLIDNGMEQSVVDRLFYKNALDFMMKNI